MSMIPNVTTPPVDPNQGGIVDIEPIPQVVVGSRNLPTYSLGPDFQFTERKVDVERTTSSIGSNRLNPEIYQDKYFQRRGNQMVYVGPGLVNGNGIVTRNPYDPSEINTEAYRYLASLDRGERIARLNFFADRGLYDGGKPTTSTFDSRDLNATSQYLLALNRWGVTDDIGLAFLQNEIPGGQMGGGRTIRVTAKEDITKVLTEESFRLLGRPMSAKEVREAVQFVQSRERQAAMGGAEQAPALSTLTEQAVTRGRGSETQLEGFRTLADLLEQALGGG
jgi:hypothetical protein